jgi:hypothetical protein
MEFRAYQRGTSIRRQALGHNLETMVMAIGILPSGVIAQELAGTVTHSRADRSCLDDIRKLLHPLIVRVIP